MSIDYKFNEGELLKELQEYVDGTYNQHYAKNKFQATEFIIDGGHGEGFCIGNVMKYAQRYGHKDGYNRKDLMKVLHYALIALYVHDKEHPELRDILDEYDDMMASATTSYNVSDIINISGDMSTSIGYYNGGPHGDLTFSPVDADITMGGTCLVEPDSLTYTVNSPTISLTTDSDDDTITISTFNDEEKS